MNDALYKAHILEHYKNPKNKAEMEDPDITEIAKNASCGDSYILYLKIHEGRIKACTFSGVGCAISQASASILSENVTGMTLEEVAQMTEKDLYAMLKVPISIGREACAVLVYHALKKALQSYA